MGKKPTVRLRVYKGKQLNYDRSGNIQNENQKVTLTHDTKQWKNFLSALRANGFLKVDVENVTLIESVKQDNGHFKDEKSDADAKLIEQIEREVKVAFELPTEQLTDDQKRIKALEEKLERITSGNAKAIEVNDAKEIKAEDDIDALKKEYEEVVGNKPHHMAGVEKLKEGIAKAKNKD